MNQYPPKKVTYFRLEGPKMHLLPDDRIIECNTLNGDTRLLDRYTLDEHFKVRFTDHELPIMLVLFEQIYAPYGLLTPLTDDGSLDTVRGLIAWCEYRLEGLGLQVAAVQGHGFLLLKKEAK